jgi:hypothetical protein
MRVPLLVNSTESIIAQQAERNALLVSSQRTHLHWARGVRYKSNRTSAGGDKSIALENDPEVEQFLAHYRDYGWGMQNMDKSAYEQLCAQLEMDVDNNTSCKAKADFVTAKSSPSLLLFPDPSKRLW